VSFSSSSGMIISGASRHRLHQKESIKTKLRSKNRLEPHSIRPRIRTHGSSVADPGCLSRSPDPNFFHPGSRICIKEFKYFNPKKRCLSCQKYDPGCSSRFRILTFYPSRIPGSKRHRIPDPDPQHCMAAYKAWQHIYSIRSRN
jgi:hypothetical protein